MEYKYIWQEILDEYSELYELNLKDMPLLEVKQTLTTFHWERLHDAIKYNKDIYEESGVQH